MASGRVTPVLAVAAGTDRYLGQLRDALDGLGLLERFGAAGNRTADLSIPTDSEELIRGYIRRLEAVARSPNTRRQYEFFARTFLAWVGKPLALVTEGDLSRFQEYLAVERNYAKSSLYLATRSLVSLFRSFGLSTADRLELPRRPARVPRYMTEPEARRLLSAVRGHPRDHALLATLALQGLRVAEVCALRVDDIGSDDGILHVRSGKGSKDRELPLDGRVDAAIQRHLRLNPAGADGRIFRVGPGRVEEIVRGAATRARLGKRVTPHVLRHSFATALLRRGVDIRILKELLGHSSTAVTELYASVDRRAIRAAVDRAGRLF
jgi:integrase/recombinase XerD